MNLKKIAERVLPRLLFYLGGVGEQRSEDDGYLKCICFTHAKGKTSNII
jgi:hypothetical protein